MKELHLFCRSLDIVPEGAHSLEQFFYSDGEMIRRVLEFRDRETKVILVDADSIELGLCKVRQAANPEQTERAMKENGVFISFEDHPTK